MCPLVRPLTDSDTVHTYTQSAHTDTQTPLVTGKSGLFTTYYGFEKHRHAIQRRRVHHPCRMLQARPLPGVRGRDEAREAPEGEQKAAARPQCVRAAPAPDLRENGMRELRQGPSRSPQTQPIGRHAALRLGLDALVVRGAARGVASRAAAREFGERQRERGDITIFKTAIQTFVQIASFFVLLA